MSDYGPDGYYADQQRASFPWSGRNPLATWNDDETHDHYDLAGIYVPPLPAHLVLTETEARTACPCTHDVAHHSARGCWACRCTRTDTSLLAAIREGRVA